MQLVGGTIHAHQPKKLSRPKKKISLLIFFQIRSEIFFDTFNNEWLCQPGDILEYDDSENDEDL
ncbi:hypothetical protein COE98_12505 [Bacillus wiedmannii]|nr:hypothetical protein [Bacillus wiedmannii]PHB91460.1 hypothetical protein COE98_12505 [Bacillus wiedmannii]PHC84856.1 hypothetical protein COF42_20695 [Bacillus wiedmannii]